MSDNLSFLGKKWIFPPENSQSGLPTGQAGLVENLKKIRGITACGFHPPEELKDLEKAVGRIRQAISGNERVLIVGDYDADGVCASVILFKALASLGAEVSVRLPQRMEHGYGLNIEFVREAKKLGVGLIVTFDNGISATQEIELASSLGIDVIITDHHLPPPAKLPPAFAIVNPRQADCEYPEKNLCGAAVAMKIAFALLENSRLLTTECRLLRAELLALAAIGTIADVCELSGENRMIVAEGLKEISRVKSPGLQKILANAGLLAGQASLNSKISSEDVGFRIAPRLNAAGRLGDPLIAFQALVNVRGAEFADGLEKLNSWRQQLTEKLLAEVEERLGEIGAEKILIAGSENFHPGIIGLLAGRLAENTIAQQW